MPVAISNKRIRVDDSENDVKNKNKNRRVLSLPTPPLTSPLLPEKKVTIHSLSTDVLSKVFARADVQTIGVARQVCKDWKRAVDGNASELWEAHSKMLGIFIEKPAKADKALGRGSAALIKELASLRGRISGPHRRSRRPAAVKSSVKMITRAYRNFYVKYHAHSCAFCKAIDNASPHPAITVTFEDDSTGTYHLCASCSVLNSGKWIRRTHGSRYFKLDMIDVHLKTRHENYKYVGTHRDNYGKPICGWGTFHNYGDLRRLSVVVHGKEKDARYHQKASAKGVVFHLKKKYLRQL